MRTLREAFPIGVEWRVDLEVQATACREALHMLETTVHFAP